MCDPMSSYLGSLFPGPYPLTIVKLADCCRAAGPIYTPEVEEGASAIWQLPGGPYLLLPHAGFL